MDGKRRGMKRKIRWFLLAAVLSLWGMSGMVLAAEGEALGQEKQQHKMDQEWQETMEGYLNELDFTEIDKLLGQQEITEGLDYRELVERLTNGEEIEKGWLLDQITGVIFSEVRSFRGTLTKIVLLCIVFAILHNFANVFEHPAVTEISFYMVYMILLVLLMNSFLSCGM